MQSTSREVDLAWLAGIIDGEGNLDVSIRKAGNGKDYFRPKVRIRNTDMRMIKRIAETWSELGLVFFYSLTIQKNTNHKDAITIEIASQGSVKKLLSAVIPYLVNKGPAAKILLDMVEYVQMMPKGGNTKAVDYINSKRFQDLLSAWYAEKKFFINPSTTTRRAREIISW